MNKIEGSSLDELIKKYSAQMMSAYSHSNMPLPPAASPASPAAASLPIPSVAPVSAPATLPASPQSPSAPTPQQEYEKYSTDNTQRGMLIVQTLTARGTYPVPNTKVVISKLFDSGEYIIATQQTDTAGKTEGVLLPAPDRVLSEYPHDGDIPFASYKVSFSHPEFTTMVATSLPIFSGESSLQRINLIPVVVAPGGETPIQYITTEPSDL